MRTILHAIVEAALCASQAKQDPPSMRGVTVQWVRLPGSELHGEPVLQVYATDGLHLAVNYVDPGDNWPNHDPIIIPAEGVKVLRALLKRVEEPLTARFNDSPVKAVIETWCDAIREDGSKINPRQVIRIDVPAACDGAVLLLAPGTPANIMGVMTARALSLGTPPGLLSTELASDAAAAVGSFGPPVWYTDGRCAFIFNRADPERAHDFALVMPTTPADYPATVTPWGTPDRPARPVMVVPGNEWVVVEGLDKEQPAAEAEPLAVQPGEQAIGFGDAAPLGETPPDERERLARSEKVIF